MSVLLWMRRSFVIVGGLWMAVAAHAQPAPWTESQRLLIGNDNATALVEHQVELHIDTATLIAAGSLRADAGDLRFGADAQGDNLLAYWIESGVGTDDTVVWVRVPYVPAHGYGLVWLFHGNPAAVSASTVDVFDYENEVQNSATQQVQGGSTGGVSNSQRGFRFRVNDELLVVGLGKNEPNGNTRWLTLFDNASQQILEQMEVSGPASQYHYQPLPAPRMLRPGIDYSLIMFQGETDGYFFGSGSQVNPHLTYLDMGYCNACSKDTYPTNSLNNIHYGYPDFQFRSRKPAAIEPQRITTPIQPSLTLATSTAVVNYSSPVQFTASIQQAWNAAGVANFWIDDQPLCTDVPMVNGSAQCETSDLPVGHFNVTAEVTFPGNLDVLSADASLQQTVVAIAPGAPRLVDVATDAGTARFFLLPPSNSGGVAITRYSVFCTDGVNEFGSFGPSSPLRLDGLQDFVTYGCVLQARNAVGDGPFSELFLLTPPWNLMFRDGFEDAVN